MWNTKRASLLVESILLNIPIPVVYVAEDAQLRWTIVDGLQRLNSLLRFFDDEFKLAGLEILSELKGSRFSNLNPKAARILKNGIIRTIVITRDSHPEIKYDIFQRLNTGAVKLNEQELRNCLYRGTLNDLLKELSQYSPFLNCTGLRRPHKRFWDAELILRYFAISRSFDPRSGRVKGYPNKMKTFLNSFMQANQNADTKALDRFRSQFKETIDKVHGVFGAKAFRRATSDGSSDRRVNRALMDVVMSSFERQPASRIAGAKEQILKLYRQLPKRDPKFNEALLLGTSDTGKIQYRLTTWLKALKKAVNA